MNRTIITANDLNNLHFDLENGIPEKSLNGFKKLGLVDNNVQHIGAEQLDDLQKATPSKPDNYTSRLLKYIPTEVIALFLFIRPLIPEQDTDAALYNWLLFGFGVIITPV